ncbi:MAG: DUF1428 domain-containing protein [Parasphingorhabdus sp.]|uniref:DUF1428 domain-containing protein n=1 Tax=Parasphingorhabdus sp. TaxID=2709688 RepID=UPI00329973D6
MAYFQGFILPVPEKNKEAYRKMAQDVAPFFADYGALRTVECWGDNVPQGKTTDMYGAVNAVEGENIVFSWINWESKQACDEAAENMTKDKRMEEPGEMPFDGMRMIYSGFELLGEKGENGPTGYVQGYVAPVEKQKREPFALMCATMREVAIDSGALHAIDGWAEKIEDGKLTDFKRAVKAETGEAVAFGFVEWPTKEAYERGSAKMREDKRMPPPGADMPVDGKRMIFGGFDVLLVVDSD